jgi:hypothetical protein
MFSSYREKERVVDKEREKKIRKEKTLSTTLCTQYIKK